MRLAGDERVVPESRARGAVGLTQVLPSTARIVAPGVAANELFQPDVNLRVGLRHLRAHLDRYRSLPDALAAYHAGPRTVDARRAKRQPVPRQYSDQVLSAVRR